MRTRGHLLTRTYDDYGYERDTVELTDLEADPYQTRNLADKDPETVARLDHAMNEWVHEQLAKPRAIPDPLQEVLAERGPRAAEDRGPTTAEDARGAESPSSLLSSACRGWRIGDADANLGGSRTAPSPPRPDRRLGIATPRRTGATDAPIPGRPWRESQRSEEGRP